jgi:hypothetical protein
MTVYVDDVRLPYGRMVMCHMWAGRIGADGCYVEDIDSLCDMADRIGVARKWIQGHPTLSFGKHKKASWVHFDISLSAKAKALAAGAVLTDKYAPLEHTVRLGRHSRITIDDIARIRIGLGLPADGILTTGQIERAGA